MSELGARGVPFANWVNFGGYFTAALILLAVLALVFNSIPRSGPNIAGLAILALYPLLIIISSLFPCDTACRPDNASSSHVVHMASALTAYLAAIIGMTILSFHARKWMPSGLLTPLSIILPIILLALLANLMPDNYFVGLVQRLFETLIYGWLIYYLVQLNTHTRRSPNGH